MWQEEAKKLWELQSSDLDQVPKLGLHTWYNLLNCANESAMQAFSINTHP